MIKIYGTKTCVDCPEVVKFAKFAGVLHTYTTEEEKVNEAARVNGVRMAPFIVNRGSLRAVGKQQCIKYLRGLI